MTFHGSTKLTSHFSKDKLKKVAKPHDRSLIYDACMAIIALTECYATGTEVSYRVSHLCGMVVYIYIYKHYMNPFYLLMSETTTPTTPTTTLILILILITTNNNTNVYMLCNQ